MFLFKWFFCLLLIGLVYFIVVVLGWFVEREIVICSLVIKLIKNDYVILIVCYRFGFVNDNSWFIYCVISG